MSSPTYTDVFQCEDCTSEQSPDSKHPFTTDDGLNDSLDGSSADLTDVFEEECLEGDAWSPPVAELRQNITAQLENYLSNENLAEDAFLLKHVQRNKMGYVSLKLLTSFKKIRELTRDWRTTLAAARTSEKLEVNEEGTKVRRKTPVPDWLLCIPTSKLLLAWNLLDSSTEEEENASPGLEQQDLMEIAMRIFNVHGTISSLRILRPGKELPVELKRFAKKHTELGRKLCTVVEYEYLDGARRAYKALQSEEQQQQQGRKGVRVVLLGSRGTRKPTSVQDGAEESSEECVKDVCSKKPSRKTKRYPYTLEDSVLYSSSESDFAPPSPRPNRRVTRPQALYGSPLAIPRVSSCRSDPYREPLCSPIGSPLVPRKLFSNNHGTSPLATPQFVSTPNSNNSSSFSRIKCSGDYSQDSAAFVGSPWVQRRKTAAQAFFPDKSCSMSPGQLKKSISFVEVLRQPIGPDGTKGFYNCIGRGKLLLR
ncbi:hypothetical protein AALO_G00127830 [Alosa alosa]|uniref:La-related protein 6 n=1 Tax=Alosa alosa TaxID=278164 RepID=A0AAV6GQT3_9TELE|nr:la-related protein 6b [Alosa alosa]KAG5276095.1 hypothetical protein AALO_G00127830 [Alosa alosa]